MKDFNLHKFLRDNPLTKQKQTLKKGKINEAFEGFGGVRGIAPIHEAPIQPKNFNWDPTDTADYDEQSQPNKWIADIDRMQPAYGDWKVTWEHPGILVWSHADVPDAMVVATPGWDGQGTPVEFQTTSGLSQMLKVLDQDEFPTFKAYLNAVKPYLDMVLDANVNPTGEAMPQGSTEFQGVHEDKYMGTKYDSSEDMAVDMVKTGVREGLPNMKTLFVMNYNSGKMLSKMIPANMQSEEIEEMLADEYGMNPNDVYYMVTDEAEIEDLDDYASDDNDSYDTDYEEPSEPFDMAEMVNPNNSVNENDFNNTVNKMRKKSNSIGNRPSRIEGLVNQRELAKFAEAVMAVAQDLDDEGFDAMDIKIFLKDKLDDMIIG